MYPTLLVFMYFSVLAGVPHATTHLLLFGLLVWTKLYENLKTRSCSLLIFSSLLFLSLSFIQVSFSVPLFNRPQPGLFSQYDGITFCPIKNIQGVPLATKPVISLIILTPMKILQRNLNRSTFGVWEMKRNVSVVRLIVVTRSSGPPASRVR
jgi:hypothetical protein